MIKKFRKKPVVIEAIQYDGTKESFEKIGKWMGNPKDYVALRDRTLIIPTLESPHEASIGDWIIKGVKNEFYPCKPDIFDETYEEV